MARTFAVLRNPVKLKVQSLGLEVIRNDEGRHILDKITADARKKAHRRDIEVFSYPL